MIIKVKVSKRCKNGSIEYFDLFLTGTFISCNSFRCYGSNILFMVKDYEVISND